MFNRNYSTRSKYKKKSNLFLIKKKIKKLFNSLGFNISVKHIDKNYKETSFNQIFLNEIKKPDPIIFDVGACDGQSINRFKDNFPNSIIHAFEPNHEEFEVLKKKFKNDKSIILNNIAIGNENTEKILNITKNSENSSFLDFDENSKWINARSKEFNTDVKNFIIRKDKIKLITLDEYIKKNQIKNIDILKIDTEGFEDKVFEGAKNSLKENLIQFIEFEIIHNGVYKSHQTWTSLEKHLIPNNYFFSGIESMGVNNIYESNVFSNNVIYILKK
tara:strand:+ start:355 stop:1176 length:822 start_codon:yes stop_codon:yes gene_type:complete